jgi:hypothetical protein
VDARGKALMGKVVATCLAIAEVESKDKLAAAMGGVPKSSMYLAMGQDLEELERVLRIGFRAGWLDFSAERVWLLEAGRKVARLVGEKEGA